MKTVLRKKTSRLEKKASERQLPVEVRQSLVLEHRACAQRMAKALLIRWGAVFERNEFESVVDLALCEAAAHFRDRGTAAFMSYAHFFIKGALIKAITAQVSASRLLVAGDSEEGNGCQPHCVEDGFPRENAPADVEHTVWHLELRRLCGRALNELEAREREAIIATYIMGEKMPAVARRLGLSRGHMFAIRSRATAKLKLDLEDFRLAA